MEAPLDLDGLASLARAATPGEWDSDPGRPYNTSLDPIDEGEWPSFTIPSHDPNSGRQGWYHAITSDQSEADAAFIAAANPSTVLRLIEAARLGEAWREVEAALPEGWLLSLNGHKDGSALASTRSTAYRSGKGELGVAQRIAVVRGPFGGSLSASGPDPAAALKALATALQERHT